MTINRPLVFTHSCLPSTFSLVARGFRRISPSWLGCIMECLIRDDYVHWRPLPSPCVGIKSACAASERRGRCAFPWCAALSKSFHAWRQFYLVVASHSLSWSSQIRPSGLSKCFSSCNDVQSYRRMCLALSSQSYCCFNGASYWFINAMRLLDWKIPHVFSVMGSVFSSWISWFLLIKTHRRLLLSAQPLHFCVAQWRG